MATSEMSFWDHLDVLRQVLFRVLGVWLVLAVGYFIAMPYLFDQVILAPCHNDFIFYQLLMGVIGTFQIGQSVITLSPRGGYNGNLNFYGLLIYNTGYVGFNMGYGSALAYMLFIIIAILSIFTFRFNKFVYYEAED